MDPQPPDEDLPPPRRPLRARWVLLILLLAALGAYLAYRQTDSYALKVLATYGIWIEITPDGVSATDELLLEPPSSYLQTLLDRIFPWRKPHEPLPIKARDLERIALLLHRLHVTSLEISQRPIEEVETLDTLAAVPELKAITLLNSPALKNLDALASLRHLEELYLLNCKSLQNIDGIDGLPALRTIKLVNAPLDNLDPLARLKGLRVLHLYSISSVTGLDPLANLQNIENLCIDGFPNLLNADAIGRLVKLEALWLVDCPALKSCDGLSGLNSIRFADIRGTSIEDGDLILRLKIKVPHLYLDDRQTALLEENLKARARSADKPK